MVPHLLLLSINSNLGSKFSICSEMRVKCNSHTKTSIVGTKALISHDMDDQLVSTAMTKRMDVRNTA